MVEIMLKQLQTGLFTPKKQPPAIYMFYPDFNLIQSGRVIFVLSFQLLTLDSITWRTPKYDLKSWLLDCVN